MTKSNENSEERAYRSIVELILTYEYKPGDFLLEVDLASRLNMSRNVSFKVEGVLNLIED